MWSRLVSWQQVHLTVKCRRFLSWRKCTNPKALPRSSRAGLRHLSVLDLRQFSPLSFWSSSRNGTLHGTTDNNNCNCLPQTSCRVAPLILTLHLPFFYLFSSCYSLIDIHSSSIEHKTTREIDTIASRQDPPSSLINNIIELQQCCIILNVLWDWDWSL